MHVPVVVSQLASGTHWLLSLQLARHFPLEASQR